MLKVNAKNMLNKMVLCGLNPKRANPRSTPKTAKTLWFLYDKTMDSGIKRFTVQDIKYLPSVDMFSEVLDRAS